jgi:F0F1-type ATP synthase membrane subunit b/b'
MSHIQFTRRLGAFMAFIGFALTIIIGGWSLGALLAFGLFIGALIYLVNRETMHTLDKTDRELAEQQRTIRRLARQRQRMHGGGGFR